MRYEKGTRIWVSGDSADLGIEDYNVRVSTSGVIEVIPTANGKKMLVTLDEIDGDHNVCVAINVDAKGIHVEEAADHDVASRILEQLGGQHFIAMTGASHFVSDSNTLRMHLPKNPSRANRLYITLDEGRDTYIMRFFRYTTPRFNAKKGTFTEEKVKEIRLLNDVYAENLQNIFTSVTGILTHL